ncbi:major facilitator superfamily domain-containing protein [Ilyonectria sp. MPI-CAGE-AT-0026]|nr:major facilitator superfamily domain-containing protein [Ilyonectria sp. MPI-CAGE-AT-0026]
MENPMTQEKSEPAPLDPAHIPNDSSDSSNDKYLHGLSLVFMTLSLMAGVFTLALDNCIIATAIPKITSDFDSLSDVAGLGAAGLFCGGLIIMTQIVEMRKRPLLLTLGGIVGLALCFYYPASFGDVPGKSQPLRKKLARLGFKSALILTATLVCLFLALQWGGAVHPWSDSRVWGCFLGFALLLILFGYIQHLQKDEALIPLRILSQRTVFLSCAFSCLLQGGLMSQSYNLPFYFQAVKGTNAQTSGINILPYGITNSVATVIAGSLMTLTGFYVPFMWLGSAISVTGSGLLYTLSASSPLSQWFGYQVLAGAGCGMSIQVPILAIQVVLSTVDIPLGTTLVILAQCFGGAIGLAIAQNVFQNSLYERLHEIQGIDVPSVVATGGVDLQHIVPAKLLDAVRDAFNGAVANAFLVAVGVGGGAFLVSLGVERRRIQTRATVQGS